MCFDFSREVRNPEFYHEISQFLKTCWDQTEHTCRLELPHSPPVCHLCCVLSLATTALLGTIYRVGRNRFTVVSMQIRVYSCIIIYYSSIYLCYNCKPTFAHPCIWIHPAYLFSHSSWRSFSLLSWLSPNEDSFFLSLRCKHCVGPEQSVALLTKGSLPPCSKDTSTMLSPIRWGSLK